MKIILAQDSFHMLPRDEYGRCNYSGDLWLGNFKGELPEYLYVDGLLYLDGSRVKTPIGLSVTGDLTWSNAGLTEVPSDLFVGGQLNLKYNNIQKLITCDVVNSIFMDYEQKFRYERLMKIYKLDNKV